MNKDTLILSFSDWLLALKKYRKLIFSVGLFLALLFFSKQIQKPLEYTSKATFKGGGGAPTPSQSSLSRALEILGGGETYSASDDPRTFLNSYPVMEKVVKALCLQAKIVEKNKAQGRLKRMWRSLKAERLYRHFSKVKPLSNILSEESIVVNKEIIFNHECPLECVQFEYPDNIARVFKIIFTDSEHFEVFENNKSRGKGSLNIPFISDSCTFTLRSKEVFKKRTFFLSAIPLHHATISLQKALDVKKDKMAPSMIHLSFTHTNPQLSRSVVNVTMDEFQKFLKEEGKQKITQQIGFLKQRQTESLADLENVMEKHKAYLEDHLEQGQMITLENELNFFSQKQVALQTEQNHISIEMQNLQKLFPQYQNIAFEELLRVLRKKESPAPTENLSLNTARELLLNHQQKLGALFLEKDEYASCLSKLSEPRLEAATFSKLLKDASLNARFEKIHTLNRNLVDDKNYTEKEKSLLVEQLEYEKAFLKKHLLHLQEGLDIEENVLSTRILALQEALFFLLFERYELMEKNLKDLSDKALSFPEKWLREQKIELNTKLQSEMCESITKMIEAKNINYHLEYLGGGPLMKAPLLFLPDPPKLFQKAFLGFIVGATLTILSLFFREIWLGPTSSLANLRNFGYKVLGPFVSPLKKRDQETLMKLKRALLKKGKKVAILSNKPTLLGESLFSLVSKKGKKVVLKSFSEELLDEDLDSFCDLLVIVKIGDLKSMETEALIESVDSLIFVTHGERLKEICDLPEQALCVSAPEEVSRLFPLFQMSPFLEKVFKKLSFFSSSVSR